MQGQREQEQTLLYPDSTSHCWHSNTNNVDQGCLAGLTTAHTWAAAQTFSTAPVIASITNTGTLTLPTATGTLGDIIASGTSAMGTGAITSGPAPQS